MSKFKFEKFKTREKVIRKAKKAGEKDTILILKTYQGGRGTGKEKWNVQDFYTGDCFITELNAKPKLKLVG